jgi:hypothetical protein
VLDKVEKTIIVLIVVYFLPDIISLFIEKWSDVPDTVKLLLLSFGIPAAAVAFAIYCIED